MSKKNTKALIALGITAACVSAAHAQDVYVGGALSAPNYNDQVNHYGDAESGRGPGAKLYGGLQLNPHVAVEAGLMNLGRTQNTGGSATIYGGFVDALGTLPLAPQWSLLGRAGLAEGRLTSSTGDTTSAALKAGVGLQYDITPTVAVRVEYEHYHFVSAFGDKPEVGQASVGLKIGF
jgi:OOP family OmpA-OmpF porin